MLVGSDFVLRSLLQDDALLGDAVAGGALAARAQRPRTTRALARLIAADAAAPKQSCSRALRRLRRREMVRIAWRDLAGLAHAARDAARDLLRSPPRAIAGATRMAAQLLAPRHGTPPGRTQALVVLGMGKLGGGELNFSSDVDLDLPVSRARARPTGPRRCRWRSSTCGRGGC